MAGAAGRWCLNTRRGDTSRRRVPTTEFLKAVEMTGDWHPFFRGQTTVRWV